MARDVKPATAAARATANVGVVSERDVALVTIAGLLDEHFAGFGSFGAGVRTIVIDVGSMTRMTSFGVRQWLKAMDALPRTVSDIYYLACPTFFVDQLNMVLNFGGNAQVLTVVAPYTCPSCGQEAGETIDVLAERPALAKNVVPVKECRRCGGTLEFDETPESYFSFVHKYAASSIQPAAVEFLKQRNLYTTTVDPAAAEKPPRIIKLVHGEVTYFRIIGSIGSMFRARPLLVGAEGEVVIDLAEVQQIDVFGQREWRRLVKSLAAQVATVTLVDINESFLTIAADTISLARNVVIASLLVPCVCIDCGRVSLESQSLVGKVWPLQFSDQVCTACGGTTNPRLSPNVLAPLQRASTVVSPASSKVIDQRNEILSRALSDANVTQAGDHATAALSADTILGKYKIVRRLSSGGMAEVFLAKQVGIGGFEKPVALKRIQRQLLETRHLAIDMFLNEAKIAGRLMHPNIVQVLDVGEVQGALYLAMEYVRGKNLRELVTRLQAENVLMPLGHACYIVREVAQALHHAYWSQDVSGQRLSVVHRDVSPHNIMIGFDGGVRLLDFGVAMSSVTESNNMIVGKWQYMSPEHTANQPTMPLDHRSDLFSLGVILYLLCVGRVPFSGADPNEIVRKVRSGDYVPLQLIAPDLPQQISQLVSRMLSPNPAERPQNGREVVAILTEAARSYGFESSAASVTQFMANLFANEVAQEDVFGETSRRRTAVELESYTVGPNGIPQLTTVDAHSSAFNAQAPTAPAQPPSFLPVPRQVQAALRNMEPRAELRSLSEGRWLTFLVAGLIVLVGVAMYLLVRPR